MRFTHLFILLYIFVFTGCKKEKLHLNKIEGQIITISDSLTTNIDIESYIKPYRNHIEKDLDSVLAYAAETYSKSDGNFNTAIGNFMADAVYLQANPIFKRRTGKDISMVLLNHGGIRSILPKGPITKRTAYEIMPFENSIVVVALKTAQIHELTHYLSTSKKAHPISGLSLTLNMDNKIIDTKINQKHIEPNKTYYVATSDYLFNGGDNMTFFKTNDSLYALNYKIRNSLIDRFTKVDTIKPVRDNRFTQIQ
ncbi:5'-nucleotidase [uncultured Algibacter sp.]|uniref:5'-nucleotidase n=1 Tax=uncultured Algibacter sp. TaxID=298659 RepID=UPI003216E528